MLHLPLQFDNTFGVPRETLSKVARYMATRFKRDEVVSVWFEDSYVEFEFVNNTRDPVRYEDMPA